MTLKIDFDPSSVVGLGLDTQTVRSALSDISQLDSTISIEYVIWNPERRDIYIRGDNLEPLVRKIQDIIYSRTYFAWKPQTSSHGCSFLTFHMIPKTDLDCHQDANIYFQAAQSSLYQQSRM